LPDITSETALCETPAARATSVAVVEPRAGLVVDRVLGTVLQ
jgi:hypothetical protein